MLKHKVSDLGKAKSYESARHELYTQLVESCGQEQAHWVQDQINKYNGAETSQKLGVLGESLQTISKLFSKKHTIISFSERPHAALSSPYGMLPFGHWLNTDLARVYLIAKVFGECLPLEARFSTLFNLYDESDTEGKVACLRALNFIEGVIHDGLTIVHDAGRTYLSELLEAAWCNNLFSSEQMNTEEFRKAIMKALFCNVSIEGFLGIDRAADQELSRRLCEYANEREAAERTVPHSVWRIASYHPIPGMVARLIGHLEHPIREERLTAAISLGRAKDQLSVPFLKDRLEREEDHEVHDQISKALGHLRAEVNNIK